MTLRSLPTPHPTDPLTALRRVLETERRAGCFDTLALADTQGLLIAGAGHFAHCEELAALAARADAASEVARFELFGTPVLLCATGRGALGLDRRLAERVRLQCVQVLGPRPERHAVH